MANGDDMPGSGRRRTGVVRRADVTRQRRSTARRDWLALVGVAVLAVVVLAVLANLFGGQPVGPTPSAGQTDVAVASATSSLKPTFSPEPSATPSPSPSPSPSRPSPPPTPSPTPTPTPLATPFPTPPPTPPPTPSPAPGPTAPAFGLIILEPVDGSTSADLAIVVRGLSQPGATITHDIPFWLDEHTVADAAGRWSFVETLNPGQNIFRFRVADNVASEVSLTVFYTPN